MELKSSKYFFTLLSIVSLYIAHTLPLYFATLAIPTILRAEGCSLSLIGLIGLLMLPWALRFLCAPWLDRYSRNHEGKRKIWIVITQLMMTTLLFFLLWINPVHQAFLLFFILFLISFFAAMQDVVSGAYVIEQLQPDQRRWGNFAQVVGTTLGSALGGALILFCYGYYGWHFSVSIVFSLSLALTLGLILSREYKQIILVKRESPSLRHFFKNKNTRYLLYMCLIYRSCEGFVMGMQQPFLVDQQLKVETIGLVMGVGNLTVGLGAAAVAGYLLKPLGNLKMLVLLGCLRGFCYLGLFLIAFLPVSLHSFIFIIIIFNMASRLMEMVTLYSIFMNHCSLHQAATDFSILVCGELLIYMLGISFSGYLAQQLGYAGLFLLGSLISFPCMLMSIYILKKIENIPSNQQDFFMAPTNVGSASAMIYTIDEVSPTPYTSRRSHVESDL